MTKTILGIKGPEKSCEDKKCPFHGEINVKKELSEGIVIKKDINHSATISWEKPYHVPKYERFEMRRYKLRVHNPACIDAAVGAAVTVAKTRPLSKTKDHVIIAVRNHLVREEKA